MPAPLKIVHLEDSPSDAALIWRVLKKSGLVFEALLVDTKEKFISALETFQPDLILADHSLPSFNSEEALEYYHASGTTTPFILVTAAMTDEYAVSMLKKGADDYILKDRPERLPMAIENALAKHLLEKERQNHLQELISNEHKYRSLIENGGDVVVILNQEFTPTYVSPSISHVLGYSEQEALLLNLQEIIHPQDVEVAMHTMQKCLSQPGVPMKGMDARLRHKNGSWRWAEATLTNMLHDPAIKGIVDNFRDITERKNAEDEIKQSEEQYRQLFNCSPLPKLIFDPQTFKILDANQAVVDHYGYTRLELLQMTFLDLLPEQEAVRTKATLHQLSSENGTLNYGAFENTTKNGTPLKVEISGHHLLYKQTNCLMVVCQDITEREKAEQALLQSNARYELVSKATSDAIWDWDLNTNDFYWSEGVEYLFGYNVKELNQSQRTWSSNVHPADLSQTRAHINAALKSEDTHWEAEYRFKKANGDYAFVSDRGFIIRDTQQNPVRMVGAMQDITKQKQLEKLLKEASVLARIGTFEVDMTTMDVFWSDITKEIHDVPQDFTPDVATGINFYKAGANREIIFNALEAAFQKGTPFDLELLITTATGKDRWVRIIGQTEIIDQKVTRFYGSIQDIDAMKKAELEMLEVYKEKNVILESIGDAFYALTKEWVVTYWNQQAEKLLGRSKEEMKGHNLWEKFPDVVGTPFYDYYQKAINEDKIQHFEAFYDKAQCWFSVTAYPSGSGLSVYFKDVTERKQKDLHLLELNENLHTYTEELIDANKGLEQFSYIVSHNLRAPVANIMGLVDLMDLPNNPQEAKDNLLNALKINIKRLDSVIIDLNTILTVKKDIAENKESINLTDLVVGITSSIQHLITQENVKISTDFSEHPEIVTVKSYLHSIFYNLILNSIKYRQPGLPPHIEIKSARVKDGMHLTFKDNGLGIDLVKKKDQLFGLYKRFHYHVEGKGLGLFMVKTQVEALGGKISVQSEVNQGVEFTILFKSNVSSKARTHEHAFHLHHS
ncbi:PAS domain S-box protein [Rufibacter sp. LB8]|uniref:PAS domain S-box protein n=1 Tax=Rufibacter sp. LB8 TaxID=2777781 RepID=UPI00178C515A|nr:PAS domain S-box protein [Rufibacter sp. LB8]